ncbi:DUF6039 family protein [Pseudoduganella buxea]|uniref:Uncharacterized protein n=1 Tax=Pseudoduganella buxea TaxID=1949069 RepID=A0A6I3ST66_9BURK|nr:DUF6039 family protein [Pseudoduganella buxea]MTV51117.1 hypothetical protein [Pseudoduganella buxea]GGB95821.1 hypothetical protein GCM10011572_17250 [Pseudoduganella buxea]
MNKALQAELQGANWSFAPPALAQLADPANVLHSLNAGMLIHRVAQVNYDYMAEARSFSLDLQGYMNAKLNPDATVLVYEEILGNQGRMHWLLHMKHPSDYGRLLHLVDHDKAFQDIYQGDRLPQRGGGNWERIFLQGSFREKVMVPQHGLAREALDEIPPGHFLPPARHQISDANVPFLDSANAGAIVLRSFQARYESRDLARYFLNEWQSHVNQRLPGAVTSAQFEEMWGRQDQLHLLIHLRNLDSYAALRQLELTDTGLHALMQKPRVNLAGQDLAWGGLFETGSVHDTVLLPVAPKTPTPSLSQQEQA